jgi:diguanylate cyclase (GGDEF)-like protein
MKKIFNNIIFKSFIISLVLSLSYTLWLSNINIVKIANLKLYDIFFAIRADILHSLSSTEDIVLVSIDDESMREMGIRWPWPRGVVAGLIKKISGHKPAVIGVDLVFVGEGAEGEKEHDLILAKAIKDAGNVFIASYFGIDGKYVIPEEVIAASAKNFGFINKPRDVDKIVRRAKPFMLSEEDKIIDYSLSLKIASSYINKTPEEIVSEVPLYDQNSFHISYFGRKNKYKIIPAWKILKDDTFTGVSIRGKIVFIGVTSEIFHDMYYVPTGLVPGVIINVAETLSYIDNVFFSRLNGALSLAIIFLFVFIATLGIFRFSIIQGIFFSLFDILVFAGGSLLLIFNNIVIDYAAVFLLIIAATIFFYGTRFAKIAFENMMLRREAITDDLTKLYDYKYFKIRVKSEVEKALRENRPLALAFYDVDHFKRVNDVYGHQFGNKVLKKVANVLKENSRRRDIVARYGGEEFCILMPDINDEDAIKQTERIREKIKQTRFTEKEDKFQITISAGLATTGNYKTDNYESFMRAADMALYKSKDLGRDRISVYGKEE